MNERRWTLKKPIIETRGKLGVLLPGMGAVGTTFIAGVEAIKKGLGKPIGSLTQMGTIRLGKRTEKRVPKIKDFVPLANLEDLVFGGWDIFEDNAYRAALKAGVLDKTLLDQLKPELEVIQPMKAVFDQNYVKKLHGTYVKKAETKWDYAQMLMEDIANF
ncbi:MAG TPA: inositol-3-phosphate synthase, partial [Bacteroidetes bacterium]|nr:inositol-3-phosphate synthase [Bacteroidota bacterium]